MEGRRWDGGEDRGKDGGMRGEGRRDGDEERGRGRDVVNPG